MKKILVAVLWSLLAVSASAQHHEEASTDHGPQVSYIGFNTLKSNHKAANVAAFHEYIRAIKPLMTAQGMTLDVYKVDHNSDPAGPVDFITFGTAKDRQSFQAFFANEDFQRAFPTLVGIIEAHFVSFVDGPVIPEKIHGGYTRLSLDWLKSTDDDMLKRIAEINHKVEEIAAHHGARQTHRVAGQFASTGLTDDIAPAEAPNVVSLWHMKDPHDFLEHSDVSKLNKQAAEMSKMYRSYWISPTE